MSKLSELNMHCFSYLSFFICKTFKITLSYCGLRSPQLLITVTLLYNRSLNLSLMSAWNSTPGKTNDFSFSLHTLPSAFSTLQATSYCCKPSFYFLDFAWHEMIQYLSFGVSSSFTHLAANDQIDFTVFKAEQCSTVCEYHIFFLHICAWMYTS